MCKRKPWIFVCRWLLCSFLFSPCSESRDCFILFLMCMSHDLLKSSWTSKRSLNSRPSVGPKPFFLFNFSDTSDWDIRNYFLFLIKITATWKSLKKDAKRNKNYRSLAHWVRNFMGAEGEREAHGWTNSMWVGFVIETYWSDRGKINT